MLTEWYPVVKNVNFGMQFSKIAGRAVPTWTGDAVRLTPPEQFAEIRVRRPQAGKANPGVAAASDRGRPLRPGPRNRFRDCRNRRRESRSATSKSSSSIAARQLRAADQAGRPWATTASRSPTPATRPAARLLLVRIDEAAFASREATPIGPHATIEIDVADHRVDRRPAWPRRRCAS